MTSTTTIKAAPTSFTTDVTLKPVLTVSSWTATTSTFNAGNTVGATKWVEKVTISLVGQPDSAKNPAKEITTWLSDNASAISTAGLTTETKVSSWAVVVDVVTKASATAIVYNEVTTKDNANPAVCYNPTDVLGANTTRPTLGAAGDTWAIVLTTGTSSNKQPFAIRTGRYVDRAATSALGQTSALGEQSWSYSDAPKDYTDKSKNTGEVKMTTVQTCDTAKWASATACKGLVGIWGANTATWATSTVAGSHRYFHWLADAATSKSNIFSIEDKEVLNLAVAEIYAIAYDANGTNKCAAAPAGTTQYGVATATYAKGSGATSTILGASALVAGLIASLF